MPDQSMDAYRWSTTQGTQLSWLGATPGFPIHVSTVPPRSPRRPSASITSMHTTTPATLGCRRRKHSAADTSLAGHSHPMQRRPGWQPRRALTRDRRRRWATLRPLRAMRPTSARPRRGWVPPPSGAYDAMFEALSVPVLGLSVLAHTAWAAYSETLPDVPTMGVVGMLGLATHLTVAWGLCR